MKRKWRIIGYGFERVGYDVVCSYTQLGEAGMGWLCWIVKIIFAINLYFSFKFKPNGIVVT